MPLVVYLKARPLRTQLSPEPLALSVILQPPHLKTTVADFQISFCCGVRLKDSRAVIFAVVILRNGINFDATCLLPDFENLESLFNKTVIDKPKETLVNS